MTKCAPFMFPKGLIEDMPAVTYKYWRKEEHISIPLVKVMKSISERLIQRLKDDNEQNRMDSSPWI